jgi:F-type H+-transporting ATPase subunit b
MISLDFTFVIHIVNMIVLMWVLNRILYRPILTMMDKRQGTLETLSQDAAQFDEQIRARQAVLDRKMQETSTQAKAVLDAAKHEAAHKGAANLAVLQQETQAVKAKELAEIQATFELARQELLQDINTVAQDMANKILGSRRVKA